MTVFFPLLTLAQQADAVLSKFFATPVGETVFLRWTITAGNSCEDTYIERSGDGLTYERIGIIGGICGSPDQSMTYEFTDSLPIINRVSYYRLELGYYGYSSPQAVEIKRYGEQGYLLAPNPFSVSTRISFENETGKENNLILSDSQGRLAMEMNTFEDEFIIYRSGMAAGVYFFRISSSDQLLHKGKLIIH